jgi:hypothetical protein
VTWLRNVVCSFVCSSLSDALHVELCCVAFWHCDSYEVLLSLQKTRTLFHNIESFSASQRGVYPEYSILCLSIVTNLNVIYFSVSALISNKQTRTEVRYISCEQQSHVLYILLLNVKLSALGFCCKFPSFSLTHRFISLNSSENIQF